MKANIPKENALNGISGTAVMNGICEVTNVKIKIVVADFGFTLSNNDFEFSLMN